MLRQRSLSQTNPYYISRKDFKDLPMISWEPHCSTSCIMPKSTVKSKTGHILLESAITTEKHAGQSAKFDFAGLLSN